jgi:hypothetical protein
LPSFEADLVTSLAAHEDLRISLPSIERGSGFDQLRKGEIDLSATLESIRPRLSWFLESGMRRHRRHCLMMSSLPFAGLKYDDFWRKFQMTS